MSGAAQVGPRVFARDGYTCVYCGRGVEDDVQLTLDHVTPSSWFARGVAAGAIDAPENLVCACVSCNSSKRDMDLDLYAAYLRRGHGWSAEEAAELRRRVRNALRRKLPQ